MKNKSMKDRRLIRTFSLTPGVYDVAMEICKTRKKKLSRLVDELLMAWAMDPTKLENFISSEIEEFNPIKATNKNT